MLKSAEWAPYRDYCFEVHGRKATTMVFGLLTVLMMPVLFWIMRRGENAIQFRFDVRTLAKFPSTDEAKSQSSHFLESILVIYQQCEIPSYPKGLKNKLKLLFGLVLSKTYFFGILFFWIYGLDQIRSDGFRCRNLKDGAGFLLSNDTEPADYFNRTFTQIYQTRKENGKDVDWKDDPVNGLLSDSWDYYSDFHEYYDYYYNYYDYDNPFDFPDIERKFAQTADLIESFNIVGFHDVCNVLTKSEVTKYYMIPPWFESRNATGIFYKYEIFYS